MLLTLYFKAYAHLGNNQKLGFSGRPMRPIGVLGTCKVSILSPIEVSRNVFTFHITLSDTNLLFNQLFTNLSFYDKAIFLLRSVDSISE